MCKKWTLMLTLALMSCAAFSQEEEQPVKSNWAKNIFSGGSVSLSFGSNSFLVGGNPVIGYKIAEWIDAGIAINYQYTSFRDYNVANDKLRQNIFGGGVFTRLYPVNFLFGQIQAEHNWFTLKYIYPDGSTPEKQKTSSNSLLVGAGYTQGRIPGVNDAFFYLAVLWDVADNQISPYKNSAGNPVPVFRAGLNIYLFK